MNTESRRQINAWVYDLALSRRIPLEYGAVNRLAVLERSRKRMTELYNRWFSAWLRYNARYDEVRAKQAAICCSDMIARIELCDAYIKREIAS
jgi:hypothetical protein